MRPKELLPILVQLIQAREQVLLVGPPGYGKTDMWKQAATKAGYRLIVKHPAVEEPVDARGFPAKADDGKHATFLPFGELWEAINATEPTLILLDDLGQASEATLKAYMQFLWGRRLNGHRLPDCVSFGAATNDVNQKSGVTGIIEPVKSRFTTILNADGNVDDWCEWALDNNLPAVLVAFMQDPTSALPDGKHALFSFEPTKEMKNSGCPRTWAHAGRLWDLGIRTPEVYWGAVGKAAATQFLAYADMASSLPSLDDLFSAPDTAPIPDKPSHQYLIATAMGRATTAGNFERAMRYWQRMAQPYRFLGIREAKRSDTQRQAKKQDCIATTQAYVRWQLGEGKAIRQALDA